MITRQPITRALRGKEALGLAAEYVGERHAPHLILSIRSDGLYCIEYSSRGHAVLLADGWTWRQAVNRLRRWTPAELEVLYRRVND